MNGKVQKGLFCPLCLSLKGTKLCITKIQSGRKELHQTQINLD